MFRCSALSAGTRTGDAYACAESYELLPRFAEALLSPRTHV